MKVVLNFFILSDKLVRLLQIFFDELLDNTFFNKYKMKFIKKISVYRPVVEHLILYIFFFNQTYSCKP